MTMIEHVATALQEVLTWTAQQLGRETKFVQRESKLGGAHFTQTLVFTYLANPDATLDELAQTAAALGVAITPEGLTQRFNEQAATLLQRVLAAGVTQVLAADPLAIPLLEHFPAVYLEDSTVIALPDALQALWPGCGTATDGSAALKINLRLDLCTGLLAGLTLHAGRVNDRQAAEPLTTVPAGALFLADLGYFSLERLATLAQQDAYFFSRLQVQTAVFAGDGQRWDDLAALLDAQATARVDLPVTLGVQQRLPARLLAVRVPQEVADQRRRRLRAEAKRKGQSVSARRLALAAWTIFVTNAPAQVVTLEAGLVLGRARWQIELLFKLWKSHGRIDESRSTKPWRVLGDVYAKLLAMIVQHWIMLIDLWGYPDRSLVKAAKTVAKYALQLATGLWHHARTQETLDIITRCLQAGCRLERRKQHPNTYQLLLAATEHALA